MLCSAARAKSIQGRNLSCSLATARGMPQSNASPEREGVMKARRSHKRVNLNTGQGQTGYSTWGYAQVLARLMATGRPQNSPAF